VTDRAGKLVEEGYLLREDLDTVVAQALARWDDIAKDTLLEQAR
jgi:hypothetical protein